MKRTNLVLDEQLLEEAVRRRIRARQILDLQGSGVWEGSLPEMRGDGRV